MADLPTQRAVDGVIYNSIAQGWPLSRVASLQGEILVQRAEIQLLQLTKLTGLQRMSLANLSGLQRMSLAKLPPTKLLPASLSNISEIPFLLCGTRLLLLLLEICEICVGGVGQVAPCARRTPGSHAGARVSRCRLRCGGRLAPLGGRHRTNVRG